MRRWTDQATELVEAQMLLFRGLKPKEGEVMRPEPKPKEGRWVFKRLSDIRREVKRVRAEAKKKVMVDPVLRRNGLRTIQSSGVEVTVDGETPVEWDGTMREIKDAVSEAEKVGSSSVYLSGSFYAAASPRDMHQGAYEGPYGFWDVEVWKR